MVSGGSFGGRCVPARTALPESVPGVQNSESNVA